MQDIATGFVVEPEDAVGLAVRTLGGEADIVCECAGLPGLIAQAIKQVRNRGVILLLGLCTRPDTFDSFAMLSKELCLVISAIFTRANTTPRSTCCRRGRPNHGYR